MKLPSRFRHFLILLASASLLFAAAPAPVSPLPDDASCTAADRQFMLRAVELAAAAYGHGNGAYGAVLVKDGKIIMEFEAQSTSSRDVTKHAETGLISAASRKFGRDALAGTILYTSTEPCIMCCGAIRSAGIKEFIYGTTGLQVARLRGTKLPENPLQCREVFERGASADTKIRGPLLEAEGLAVHAVGLSRQASR
ncbi:MAG: nucleoside deaminase [Verrucomicrobiota bacterium]